MINLLENTRRPDISFSRNGQIRITARVARLLALSSGDSVNIAMSGGEYLLHAIRHSEGVGRHEAQCFPTKKGSLNFCAYSVRLCAALFNSVNFQGPKVSYMVGKEFERNGVVYVPIITLHPL